MLFSLKNMWADRRLDWREAWRRRRLERVYLNGGTHVIKAGSHHVVVVVDGGAQVILQEGCEISDLDHKCGSISFPRTENHAPRPPS